MLLFELLGHKNGRVRWESMHAFALVASLVPGVVSERLDALAAIIRGDKSIIVRDYAIDAVAAWGATGSRAARRALPMLSEAISVFEGRHAARALNGLAGLVAADPSLKAPVLDLAQTFRNHEKAGFRKSARLAVKACGR